MLNDGTAGASCRSTSAGTARTGSRAACTSRSAGPDPSDFDRPRKYTEGRWLFDVTRSGPYLEDTLLRDGLAAWTDDLAQYRPAGVQATGAPASSRSTRSTCSSRSDIVPIAALVGALLIAILAYILILRRRRRPPEWMR